MTLEINREGTVMTCGGPWPRDRFAPTVLLENDIAIDLVADAKALSELIAEQKRLMFAKAEAFEIAVMAAYNANKKRKTPGRFTACSLDERFKVELSVSDFRRVNADIMAAQALMSEVLDDLTEGSNDDVRLLLTDAFVPDARTGRINTDRLQKVRRLRLSHPRWPDVCEAIANSIKVSSSRSYLRFYERESDDHDWVPVVLQFSAL